MQELGLDSVKRLLSDSKPEFKDHFINKFAKYG